MGSLRLSHVTKRYDDVVAVNDMNLDIEDSEFISLVGPSGCGKSTTLKMIGGLTKPSDGNILIDDEDVTNDPPKDRGLAMVFQNIALFPHMNVYDNMSYGLRIRGTTKDEIDQRVDEAAETLKLEGMLERMPSELSGGQRQRVAIGRAIVREPEVFLMDEPLANLDAKLRVHMRTELQRIQRKFNVTTIYVTHDQEEAMTMSDRVAIINEGELQQIAPPLECYHEPENRFVAGFIGSPSMNFIEGTVHEGQFRSEKFDLDLRDFECDGTENVTVGIRPEDVYLADSKPVDGSKTIRATVDVTEPIGEKVFVYLYTRGEESTETELSELDGTEGSRSQFLMSAPPDTEISEGDEIDIVLDRRSIHLFDTETGEAIVHGAESEPAPVP
ncbi:MULTISPECIES: ABC transporter ATP-binding protein [unclassified Haladaptatus]|uniref:ABC transporter ATP-binding protein n=1 Tax=unclassified Haladaptatus TaxID=2622732 RepID=UPI00209C33FB|nr:MULTISPECIES: ABC transporter ATP-binding protein [unclassified Haladaptatus]MCO8243741.1 ABC transporter ATP-binding protein [Haladaptatus sp. AB643]MCO8255150.1 ABC transporter ATP-binding protein [Haladaptatus sp. AB618]